METINYTSTRKLILSSLLFAILLTTGCSKECDCPEPNEEANSEIKFPQLKIVNDLQEDWRSIKSVSLVGYTFGNLDIQYNGGSKTFDLKDGIAGGYNDVNVNVGYLRYAHTPNTLGIKVNFRDGQTTTIRLSKCLDSSSQCLSSD